MLHRMSRAAVGATVLIACAATIPRWIVGREAGALFEGERPAQEALANGVVGTLDGGVSAASFHTGSARFDGEWALVTQVTAVLGLGQVISLHPELRERYLPALEACGARLVAPEATAFGTAAWGAGALEDLGSDRGHAYLGYVALALGMVRRVSPETRLAGVHDRIIAALARRLAAAPYGLVETYPGEAYPADVASIAGAIGSTIGGGRQEPGGAPAARRRVAGAVDRSGVGAALPDGGRGPGRAGGSAPASGTALAAYFVSFADPALARELFAAIARSQRASFLGFGGVREYAAGYAGSGDIDSGPVLFGVSVSATGFALAGARASGDRALYTELYRTADLFGVPVDRGAGRRFATGGPLGNALLLAVLTAERWP